jgi:hypothetical protein
VHDALIVGCAERIRDLQRDGPSLLRRQGAILQPLGERDALDELHDERGHRAGRLEAVDLGNVRGIQRGQRPRFAAEPREALGVVGHRVRQDLQGDIASESRVARPVDLAHAAGPDPGDDLVGADVCAWWQRHVISRLRSPCPGRFSCGAV